MAKVKSIDPFVCSEPVEISPATGGILKQRMKTADEGRVVSAEKARQRIQKWISKPCREDALADENRRTIKILHFWHNARKEPQLF